ncbi:hypothetical protein HLH36_14425 [Gluconacetobacter aggeris]|uniref:Uncharacterized protein n=1 Tax=Gluconacetobacter aggeris TaxID=1286186 RepID=A0A7W4IVJ7_9PROT|nr:hypothetical protein [Gluconacetobacter aggeris]MBB2169532.1 hypothetical protein [Gluconacetobacter aggeris]
MATIIAVIASACLLVGGFVFQVPFCLGTLDWLGRHRWIWLTLGVVISIWRRWNVPYAERVRQGW